MFKTSRLLNTAAWAAFERHAAGGRLHVGDVPSRNLSGQASDEQVAVVSPQCPCQDRVRLLSPVCKRQGRCRRIRQPLTLCTQQSALRQAQEAHLFIMSEWSCRWTAMVTGLALRRSCRS